MRRRGGLLFVARCLRERVARLQRAPRHRVRGVRHACRERGRETSVRSKNTTAQSPTAATTPWTHPTPGRRASTRLVNIHHCGSCGHDCLGGACSGGKCLPAVVATDVAGGFSIAIDETHVYLDEPSHGEIMRAPKSGGAPSVLFSKADTTLGEGIFVRGGQLYFATADEDGGILHCPKTGCGGAGPAGRRQRAGHRLRHRRTAASSRSGPARTR